MLFLAPDVARAPAAKAKQSPFQARPSIAGTYQPCTFQGPVMSTAPYVPPIDGTSIQHDGTSHLAIRNTLPHRLLTLMALKTTAHFYRCDGPCVPISKHTIVKTGPFVYLTEAATMKFVAGNTSIPVPAVHCSFIHNNRAFIVMERIQAKSLADAWNTLLDTDRTNIFAQFRDMLQELRALPQPSSTGVESCLGGSLCDSRIPGSRPRFGALKSIQDLHLWLREDLKPEEHPDRTCDQDWEEIKEMVAQQDGPWPSPVFTHGGDLNPFNILVRGDQVVSIIEWEFAGWYPHYWDYTSAWHGNRIRQEWQDLIIEFLDIYPAELEMEKTRQKWWGDL